MGPATDLVRAVAFLRRTDAAGAERRAWRFGEALFTPEVPHRWDSNLVVADELPAGLDAEALFAAVEDAYRGRGLAHRTVIAYDPGAAGVLAGLLEGTPWSRIRLSVMAQRRPPEAAFDTGLVEEAMQEELREARRLWLAEPPRPAVGDVAEQLLAARRILAAHERVRCFAVRQEGVPVAWCDLYGDGDVAQVEDVVTLPAARGRGYAKAVVMRAAEEARAGGAGLVFLVADRDDWPERLYERLGFDVVGEYLKAYRLPPDAA